MKIGSEAPHAVGAGFKPAHPSQQDAVPIFILPMWPSQCHGDPREGKSLQDPTRAVGAGLKPACPSQQDAVPIFILPMWPSQYAKSPSYDPGSNQGGKVALRVPCLLRPCLESSTSVTARFRLSTHTLELFEKHGIRNVGYWTVDVGDANDRLIYIVAYRGRRRPRKGLGLLRRRPRVEVC